MSRRPAQSNLPWTWSPHFGGVPTVLKRLKSNMTVVNEQMTLASLYGPCTRMGEKERGLKRSSAPLGLVVTTKVSALMKKLISGDGQKKGCQGVRCCLEDACCFQNISPLKFPTLSKEKCIAFFFYLVCLHIHEPRIPGYMCGCQRTTCHFHS